MTDDLFANRRKVKAVSLKVPVEPAPVVFVRPAETSESSIWEKSFTDLDNKLNLMGFKIVPQESDGNCLFRAFSEALIGAPTDHLLYRSKAVNFMREHSEDFLPFVAENKAEFEQYLGRMSQPNVWGGEPEIQALSRGLQVNVAIFQTDGKPEIFMENFGPVSCVTLAYHGTQHYNLVGGGSPGTTLEEVKRRLCPPPPPPPPPAAATAAAEEGPAPGKKKMAGLFRK